MSNRVTLLNGYMDAAIAAVAAGDYDTALAQALAAQGMIASLPRVNRSAGSGGGSQSADWDAQGIDNFIRRLRQQQGASLGVQRQNVEFIEPEVLADSVYSAPTGATQ